MNSTWALVLAGMVVVTYGIRLSFLVFGHRLTFPRWLERALRYVPAAVLTALVVPMALAPQGAALEVREVAARVQHAPGGGAAQACQSADQGGFTSAVGAQQAEEFALLHIKADLVQRFERGCARLFGWVNLGDGLERERWHLRRLF